MSLQFCFVHATSKYGPVHFPCTVLNLERLPKRVEMEAQMRGTVFSSEFSFEIITWEQMYDLIKQRA